MDDTLHKSAIAHFTQAADNYKAEIGDDPSPEERFIFGMYVICIEEMSGLRQGRRHGDSLRAGMCPVCREHHERG